MTQEARRPRRPAAMPPIAFDAVVGTERDPATVLEIAHETAAVLVHQGRASADPEVTARLVRLVDEIGLADLATLWAQRPARTLPGALWRLYVLREWVRRDPAGATNEYRDGLAHADVAALVAGVASPPGPKELADVADDILRGVFDGDLSVALHRAAAFCRVVAAGRGSHEPAEVRAATPPLPARDRTLAHRTDDPEPLTDTPFSGDVRRAAAVLETADDLDAAARAWSAGMLD